MRRLLILLGLALLVGVRSGWAQSAARQSGYLYLSPVPQASYVSAQTRYVLVRFVDVAPSAITNLLTDFFTVTGASSGPHSGTARIASDNRTVIFTMNSFFIPYELVTIYLAPKLGSEGGTAKPFAYQFMTTGPMPGSLPLASLASQLPVNQVATNAQPAHPRISDKPGQPRTARQAMIMPNGVSVPTDFPKSVITVNSDPSPGYLFLENALDGVPPYSMMLDNNGQPVWYSQGRLFDFKVQRNATISYGEFDDAGLATFYGFDQNFNPLRTYVTTNGYLTDGHDFKVLADGSYYMIGDQNVPVDMSRYVLGGPTSALVTETVVQGFTAADELIFQWRSWDNYNIRDVVPLGNTDFAHMNGVDIDDDGNILVSARHLSEVTKINRDSGDIMWRLGGVHDSFTFVNDPLKGPSYQHDISALGKAHYMVFDNGDYHSPQVSRAVEYQLDLTNMTATLVWQFRDSPDRYSFWLGSAQRLPSGRTLIDFDMAQYPKAIEVDSNSVKHFELSLVPGSASYRAFRFPWNGVVAAPYLLVEPQPDNLTLVFNKFGDTNVAYYRIYGGPASQSTNLLAESDTSLTQLTNLVNGLYYLRVTAVSHEGVESAFSNEQSVYVNITRPGVNMVQNGDFSNATNSWQFTLVSPAKAGWTIANGASQFYVTNGGASVSSIQLVQSGVALILGDEYVLEFDAWSGQSRYIQARITKSLSPFTDYTGLAATFLTPNRAHYRYVFAMTHPSDFSANLIFSLGGSTSPVYLANVSLFRPPVGDLNLDAHVDLQDLGIFSQDWLLKQNGLPGDLDGNGKVDFNDLDILGQNWGLGSP